MSKINLFCVMLITYSIASPAYCGNVFRIESFNIFSALGSFIGGISNFVQVINSLTDIFSAYSDTNSTIHTNSSIPIPEDAFLNVHQLIVKYGYDFEEHQVVTEDGYKINIHRIPRSRNSTSNNMTVFLMHGLMDSSDSWILQGPDNALAYILADEGFDVWMGNARGNKHAMSHVNMTPYMSDFWQFTWEEIGLYDLPAMVDYVLNVTEKQSLHYIGHSQGTTNFYVMNSLKPEYNKKIRMMFSLAPEAYMRHVRSPIVKIFSPAYKILAYLMSNFNTYSPTTDFFNKIATVVCSVMPKRCDNLLYLIVGNNGFINDTTLPVVLGHMPTSASTMQFVHYGQLVESGRFCRFDFGEEKNLEYYGVDSPPDYNLGNITVPVVLYYSGNDWLSDPFDVELLKSKLPNVAGVHYIENFNHLDFMYSSAAKEIIYKKVIDKIRDYEDEL